MPNGQLLAISVDGYVTMPGYGVVHTNDLMFAPDSESFPYCWVRIKDEVLERPRGVLDA